MINKVTLIGHLGKDPELRTLENGTAVANFSVATNEGYKDKNGEWQDHTEWHNVVAWRDLAERAEKALKKGKLVYLEGKLSTRKYTGTDGVERYATDVVASAFRLLEKKEGGSSPDKFPSEPPAQYATSNAAEPAGATADDLPF